jgi:hypothetical protein
MKSPSLRANGSRERAPDDRLREAIHRPWWNWIASSPRSSQCRSRNHDDGGGGGGEGEGECDGSGGSCGTGGGGSRQAPALRPAIIQ